jgi:uncharacterized membrane-anchored protein
MLKAPIRILIVATLCALALVGLVVRETMARSQGTEVLLAMQAVDPRALLSGHYVIVALSENLPDGAQCPSGVDGEAFLPPPLRSVQTGNAWVALKQHGGAHTLAGAAASRQEALSFGPLVVRGTASCMAAPPNVVDQPPGVVRLDLGIDRFHINQADAQRIERVLRTQTLGERRILAIVSVGQDGRARLKGLQVDGERLELNWL